MNKMQGRMQKEDPRLQNGSTNNCDSYTEYGADETSWFWRNLPFFARVRLLYNSMSSGANEDGRKSNQGSPKLSPPMQKSVVRPTSLMTSYTKCPQDEIVVQIEHDKQKQDDYEHQVKRMVKEIPIKCATKMNSPVFKEVDHEIEQIYGTKLLHISEESTESVYDNDDDHLEMMHQGKKPMTDREANLWSLRKSLEADNFHSKKINIVHNDFTPEGGGDCSPCSTSSSERMRSETLLTSDDGM